MKVSVIIPVYNRADYLPTAVASVLATGYQDLEILIVDDGSRDLSLEVARNLRDGDHDRIRLLRHPGGGHAGISASRNLGIRESSGDLTCFLDSDDAYLPNRFASALDALRRDLSLDGCYEPVIRVEDRDFQDFIAEWHMRLCGPLTDLVDADEGNAANLMRQAVLQGRALWHTATVTVRRSLFDQAGLFDPRFRVAEDTHLWLRMAAVGRLQCAQRALPVAVVRRHSDHSWQPTPDESNRVFTRAVAAVLRWARQRPNEVDPEIVDILEEGLYRSAIDTIGLLRERQRPGAAIATVLHVVRAAPKLVCKNLLWRKALEPRRLGEKSWPRSP